MTRYLQSFALKSTLTIKVVTYFMALPFLEQFGLTTKEAKIYELLLKIGESPAVHIIKETGYKRATVYKSLYSLEEKALVSQSKKGSKTHFKPASPTQLTTLAEAHMSSLERARMDLQSLLPELTSNYILSVERPVVSTFEGVDGLKKIYEDTLSECKTLYSALTTAEVEPKLFSWITRSYVKRRIQAHIEAKVIVASGGWAQKYAQRSEKELREVLLVPKKDFPFQHEFIIYGDKVAFIDFKKGGSLIGIVIHHPATAQTVHAMWHLAWKGAQSLQKKAQT